MLIIFLDNIRQFPVYQSFMTFLGSLDTVQDIPQGFLTDLSVIGDVVFKSIMFCQGEV